MEIEEQQNQNLLPQETPAIEPSKPVMKRRERGSYSWVLIFFVVFAVYFIISIFIGNIILKPLAVYGRSMYPTLNQKATGVQYNENTDVVYITRDDKYKVTLEKGNIIVFDATKMGYPNELFIKRLIACSGDTIQFKATSEATEEDSIITFEVFLNGTLIDESSYASEMHMQVGYPNRTDVNASDLYKKLISEQIITIPEGKVFVMGDNRDHSTDGRFFSDFVSEEDVLGKVVIHSEYGSNLLFSIIHSIKENYLFWGIKNENKTYNRFFLWCFTRSS